MPIAAPQVNRVTIWIVLMHSLPVSLLKLYIIIPITKIEMAMRLNAGLLLISFSLVNGL